MVFMQIMSAVVPTHWVCSRTLRRVVFTVPKQRAGRTPNHREPLVKLKNTHMASHAT